MPFVEHAGVTVVARVISRRRVSCGLRRAAARLIAARGASLARHLPGC